MFKDILNRLLGEEPHPQPLASSEAELAIAALLVRVARSDDSYDETERQRIDRVLARRRGLSHDEAAHLRHEAEAMEAEASDTVRFTRQIKDMIALDDRAGVIEAMWEVAYADEDRAADEESLIRLVAGLLGIPDRESGQIRQRVLDRMGLPRS